MTTQRVQSWSQLLAHAADIVNSYNTRVTLRQLFYRLVSDGSLPNEYYKYQTLAHKSAEARRDGLFPDLMDETRRLHNTYFDDDIRDALETAVNTYQIDRTIGQEYSIYLGIEKEALKNQLLAWFGRYGFPIVVLRGNASQGYVEDVKDHVIRYGIEHMREIGSSDVARRPSVLVYAGDFDPSGEDIERDFVERVEVFDEVVRVAVLPEQVIEYGLIMNPAKENDTRLPAFVANHRSFFDEHNNGRPMQVETDAIEPNELKNLFQNAINQYWSYAAFAMAVEKENVEKGILRKEVAKLMRKLGEDDDEVSQG